MIWFMVNIGLCCVYIWLTLVYAVYIYYIYIHKYILYSQHVG